MMGFNLSALAVRERAITLFLIVAVILAGGYAFLKLGRAEDPTFTVKVLTVSAAWPGATAQEMQDLVAEPLEKRLQELRWYDRVETFTRPGLALMTVSPEGRHARRARSPSEFYQARKKLGDEARNLPQGALGPFVNDEYSDVTFALYAVEGAGHAAPPADAGGRNDCASACCTSRASRRSISWASARNGSSSSSPMPGWRRSASAPAISSTRSSARTRSRRRDRSTPTARRSSSASTAPMTISRRSRDTPIVSGGRTLKLSDVAEVERGYEDPATFLIRHNGEPALMLGVVMQDGWNGLDLGKALEAEQKKIIGGTAARPHLHQGHGSGGQHP